MNSLNLKKILNDSGIEAQKKGIASKKVQGKHKNGLKKQIMYLELLEKKNKNAKVKTCKT